MAALIECKINCKHHNLEIKSNIFYSEFLESYSSFRLMKVMSLWRDTFMPGPSNCTRKETLIFYVRITLS